MDNTNSLGNCSFNIQIMKTILKNLEQSDYISLQQIINFQEKMMQWRQCNSVMMKCDNDNAITRSRQYDNAAMG
jgi:hypothetical protein